MAKICLIWSIFCFHWRQSQRHDSNHHRHSEIWQVLNSGSVLQNILCAITVEFSHLHHPLPLCLLSWSCDRLTWPAIPVSLFWNAPSVNCERVPKTTRINTAHSFPINQIYAVRVKMHYVTQNMVVTMASGLGFLSMTSCAVRDSNLLFASVYCFIGYFQKWWKKAFCCSHRMCCCVRILDFR